MFEATNLQSHGNNSLKSKNYLHRCNCLPASWLPHIKKETLSWKGFSAVRKKPIPLMNEILHRWLRATLITPSWWSVGCCKLVCVTGIWTCPGSRILNLFLLECTDVLLKVRPAQKNNSQTISKHKQQPIPFRNSQKQQRKNIQRIIYFTVTETTTRHNRTTGN